MAVNFLEQLVAEWYEYDGYFIRRNVKVGKRAAAERVKNIETPGSNSLVSNSVLSPLLPAAV
jgi:hypothetical protein